MPLPRKVIRVLAINLGAYKQNNMFVMDLHLPTLRPTGAKKKGTSDVSKIGVSSVNLKGPAWTGLPSIKQTIFLSKTPLRKAFCDYRPDQ
jgi:hypothetical protein